MSKFDTQMVESVGNLVDSVRKAAEAITITATPGRDASDSYVGCLTEAVMGVTAGLFDIASAIRELAHAVSPGDSVSESQAATLRELIKDHAAKQG